MRNSTLVLLGVLLAACCVAYALIDVDREDVQSAAREAARGISKKHAGKYLHRLHRVLKVNIEEDRHGDALYKMDVVVGMTECTKTDERDIEDCEFQNNQSTYKKCEAYVNRNSGVFVFRNAGCILASGKEI